MKNGADVKVPQDLSSVFRGLYRRIAGNLNVDPSYVSRVARGERKSRSISVALEKEIRKTIGKALANHNGFASRAVSHNGSGHNGIRKRASRKT